MISFLYYRKECTLLRLAWPCVLAVTLIVIAGCANFTQQELVAVDFGEPPTRYESQIRTYMKDYLYDSYWAQYEFGKPYKAAYYQGLLSAGSRGLFSMQEWSFGYAIDVKINDLSIFRQYIGYARHMFFFYPTGGLKKVHPIWIRQIE